MKNAYCTFLAGDTEPHLRVYANHLYHFLRVFFKDSVRFLGVEVHDLKHLSVYFQAKMEEFSCINFQFLTTNLSDVIFQYLESHEEKIS